MIEFYIIWIYAHCFIFLLEYSICVTLSGVCAKYVKAQVLNTKIKTCNDKPPKNPTSSTKNDSPLNRTYQTPFVDLYASILDITRATEGEHVYSRCSEPGYGGTNYTITMTCLNCKEQHISYSNYFSEK